MIYNILSLPDIHWGVIDPDDQWKSLQFIFEAIDYLEQHNTNIDLIVIAGDYFDSKLPLNSKEAILAIQWFHELYQKCHEYDIKIRMFQGTMEHDNEQLEAFRSLTNGLVETDPDTGEREYGPEDFRIFMKTTSEETLPGLQCIYCPDETIQTDEYEETYLNEILKIHDIGFFHGSFDVVYGSLLESNPSLMSRKNVIYNYHLWDRVIRGPLISGHWHDGKQWENLYYGGSPFRYKFDELEDKGIQFISYDTDTHDYFVDRIRNPFATEYITFELYSNTCTDKTVYTHLIEEVEKAHQCMTQPPLSYTKNKIRVVLHINDEKPTNDVLIDTLRKQFINRKDIKFVLKNKMKAKRKKEEKERIDKIEKEYSFIHDAGSCPEIIQQFIATEYQEEVPLEFIQKKYQEYVKEK